MSLARLVLTVVTVEGRRKSEVARDYGVSRVWVQKLVRPFQAEGEAAFPPRSRRPDGNPRAISVDVEDRIVRRRNELSKVGVGAGAETIAAHLVAARVDPVAGVSTIWRILGRRGSSPRTAEAASLGAWPARRPLRPATHPVRRPPAPFPVPLAANSALTREPSAASNLIPAAAYGR